MIAPTSEPKKPAGSPALYKPSACPPYVASNEPAIPIATVMIKPLGSRPGVSIFARSPTTKPTRMIQMMVIVSSMDYEFPAKHCRADHCRADMPALCAGTDHLLPGAIKPQSDNVAFCCRSFRHFKRRAQGAPSVIKDGRHRGLYSCRLGRLGDNGDGCAGLDFH